MSSPMEQFYKEFQQLPQEQQELFKVIQSAFKSDKNLNMITDIKNPLVHSALDVFAIYCQDIGQNEASKYIKAFSKSVKEQMVSHKRQGRIEFKEMVSSALQRLRSFSERMTGTGKE